MPGLNLYTHADILAQMRWWNLLVNKNKHRFPEGNMPPTFKMSDMAKFIKTDEDVERFGELLGRFNKRESQGINPLSGNLKFLDNEINRTIADINAQREQTKAMLYPDFDKMSRVDQIKAIAAGNIAPVSGDYKTGEDYKRLLAWSSSENVESYTRHYLDALRDYMPEIAGEVERVIDFLRDAGFSEAIKAAMDSGSSAVQIKFIYPPHHKGAVTGLATSEWDKQREEILNFWHDFERNALTAIESGEKIYTLETQRTVLRGREGREYKSIITKSFNKLVPRQF